LVTKYWAQFWFLLLTTHLPEIILNITQGYPASLRKLFSFFQIRISLQFPSVSHFVHWDISKYWNSSIHVIELVRGRLRQDVAPKIPDLPLKFLPDKNLFSLECFKILDLHFT
jgi:hypothetical protein